MNTNHSLMKTRVDISFIYGLDRSIIIKNPPLSPPFGFVISLPRFSV